MAADGTASFHIAPESGGRIRLFLSGRLEISCIGGIWEEACRAVAGAAARGITIDCGGVESCDSAGAALISFLSRGGSAEVVNLPDTVKPLIELLSRNDHVSAAIGETPPRLSLLHRLSASLQEQERNLADLLVFTGEAFQALLRVVWRPSALRWKDVWSVMEEAGVNALPIVSLIAFLLGVIMAFQSAVVMKQFGSEIFVANLVGISILRELGPLITVILLAGRSGAAFAAEIGTMKVNEELNALQTMGLNPVRFLVMPRLVAAVAITPLLVVYADFISLLGGGLVMKSFDIPLNVYASQIASAVKAGDFMGGIVKSVVYGILVAGIGCLRGVQTGTGAAAVGLSTTSAVVSGLVAIVVADGLFAVIFYYLGV